MKITSKPSHARTPRLSRDCTFQGSYVRGSTRRLSTKAAVLLVAAAAVTALSMVGASA